MHFRDFFSVGTIANAARNGIVNATELATYNIVKQFLVKKDVISDSMPGHIMCGFASGIMTTLLASPVDVAKTRYVNSAPNTYSGILNCIVTMAVKEGPFSFYKG